MIASLDDKAVTYALFAESGGSTEILGAMDTNLKSKDLIYYGAGALVVLSCNEDLRASLSEGDGISLIVDALHCHKRDDPTSVVLQALLINLLYRNTTAKKACVASNGVPIVCSILSGAHTRETTLTSSLHALRHLSTEKDVKIAESKNRSQIFKDVIASMVDNTQNEPIVLHGLWIFLNLMNGSHDNKTRFLAENGVALLESITQDQERNDSIMHLVAATYHQLLKVQRIRTELFAKHTLAQLKKNLETFSEAKPLIATYRALYAFSFHSTARNSIGLETASFIIQHLQLPHISVGLAAILGKLVLKLSLDPEVKEHFIELKGAEAVRTAIGHSQDQLGSLRFLVAAEQFLNSLPGSDLPSRPDVADLLLMHHVHPDASDHDNRESFDSPRSESSTSSEGASSASSEDDDEISAELKHESHHSNSDDDETSPSKPVSFLPLAPVAVTASNEKTAESPKKSPRVDTPVPMDDEFAALLEDIEISTSPVASPTPSPIKSKPHHMKVVVTPKAVPSLDDSFSDLDAELERLKEKDFGGIRALDRFDDLESSSDHMNTSTSDSEEGSATDAATTDSTSPDAILARIEAIEKMTEELDSMSSPDGSLNEHSDILSYAEVAALPPKPTVEGLDELDDAVKALELTHTTPSPEPASATEPSPRSDSSEPQVEEPVSTEDTVEHAAETPVEKVEAVEPTTTETSSPVEPTPTEPEITPQTEVLEPEVPTKEAAKDEIPQVIDPEPIAVKQEIVEPEAPSSVEPEVTTVTPVDEPVVVEEPVQKPEEEPTKPEETPEVLVSRDPVHKEVPTATVSTPAEEPKVTVEVTPFVEAKPAVETPQKPVETPQKPVETPVLVPEPKHNDSHRNGSVAPAKNEPKSKKAQQAQAKVEKAARAKQASLTKPQQAPRPIAIYATVGVLVAVMAAAAVSYML